MYPCARILELRVPSSRLVEAPRPASSALLSECFRKCSFSRSIGSLFVHSSHNARTDYQRSPAKGKAERRSRLWQTVPPDLAAGVEAERTVPAPLLRVSPLHFCSGCCLDKSPAEFTVLGFRPRLRLRLCGVSAVLEGMLCSFTSNHLDELPTIFEIGISARRRSRPLLPLNLGVVGDRITLLGNCNQEVIMRSTFLAISILALLIPVSAWSQSEAVSAQLSGTIQDENGATVPGAKVTLSNSDVSFAREVTTGDNGLYTFTLIPPEIRFKS